jgi:hypothetical protein
MTKRKPLTEAERRDRMIRRQAAKGSGVVCAACKQELSMESPMPCSRPDCIMTGYATH